MQDRPTAIELLAAIERFLQEELLPSATGARGFHARVAANTVRIVRREMEIEDEALDAEWSRLDVILGPAPRPARRDELRAALHQRTRDLCERIRRGEADGGDFGARVRDHVRQTVRDKLRATNPGWIGLSP